MPDQSAVDARIDQLFALLPAVYRRRDAANGWPLRDLLRVIAEQLLVVEDDIASLYENWFIETCDDWVVPYIGDLVGYAALPASPPDDSTPAEARLRARALTPRRDVANYIRSLRRRGTLALLEVLANDSAGFPARAVQFFTLLGATQSLNHLNERGGLVDLRAMEALDLLDSPFDRSSHTIDVRGVNAVRNPGWYNIPSAAAYVWRLRPYPVTNAPAFFRQRGVGYFFYTFTQLGNNAPLFTNATREPDPTTIAGPLNVPQPISRRALDLHLGDYYGADRSFSIWLDDSETPVPAEDILAADLTSWNFRPVDGKVAVDPQLGLIAMTKEPSSIRVSYHYGFSGDVGAHESPRTLTQPRKAKFYRVGPKETYATVGDALRQWRTDPPADAANAVIEITDSGRYEESIQVELAAGTTLQIRAANRCRPLLYLLDFPGAGGKSLHVRLHDRTRFTLDGLMVAGLPLLIEGAEEKPVDAAVTIRRCTLVPGWDIGEHCEPRVEEASISVQNVRGTLTVASSIIGAIGVMDDTTESEPMSIDCYDSIIDATAPELDAIVGPGGGYAWATLRILRCTVFGDVFAHEVELGENAIFNGIVRVVRRQTGCIRFCYVAPVSVKPPDEKGDLIESRTPRRYHCQPDLVEQAARQSKGGATPEKLASEDRRVKPRFGSTRFGFPDYCQLAFDCAIEITQGADDQSEMGAFHDLFLPQRIANLRSRIDHSTPAGMETGIITAD